MEEKQIIKLACPVCKNTEFTREINSVEVVELHKQGEDITDEFVREHNLDFDDPCYVCTKCKTRVEDEDKLLGVEEIGK